MNELCFYPPNDYRDYLEHHGVEGMQWGVRNAKWYPIADYKAHLERTGGEHDADETLKKRRKALEKARKVKKANAKAKEKAKKEEVKKKELKEAILKRGTPGDVVRYAPNLTSQEISEARKRHEDLARLKELENTRIKDIKDKKYRKKHKAILKATEDLKLIRDFTKPITDMAKPIVSILQEVGILEKKDKDKKKKKKGNSEENSSSTDDDNNDNDSDNKTVDEPKQTKPKKPKKKQDGDTKSQSSDVDYDAIYDYNTSNVSNNDRPSFYDRPINEIDYDEILNYQMPSSGKRKNKRKR